MLHAAHAAHAVTHGRQHSLSGALANGRTAAQLLDRSIDQSVLDSTAQLGLAVANGTVHSAPTVGGSESVPLSDACLHRTAALHC
jgi:hypothetical protein